MIIEFLLSLLVLLFVSMMICFVCDAFELVADYVGCNLFLGVKGAIVNAIGSFLLELITIFIFLFGFVESEGFEVGVVICAGSAVFNIIVIFLFCVFVVFWIGVK